VALYHKYRPRTFRRFVGNEAVVDSLREILARDREAIPHAFLFHGPTGCGKTTLARIVSRKLGCKGADFREIDSADFRGVDTIRAIRKNMHYSPLEGDCRVWVLDEAHQVSVDGQNALLKALEDTPDHVYFILCTTDPQKLLPTIRGRCHQYEVSPLSETQMETLLKGVVKLECADVPDEVIEQIVVDSMGLPRNALQLLDKAIRIPKDKMLEVVEQEARRQAVVVDLCRSLLRKESWKKLTKKVRALKEDGNNPESVRIAIFNYFGAILSKEDNRMAAVIMEALEEPVYVLGWAGLVFKLYTAWLDLKEF